MRDDEVVLALIDEIVAVLTVEPAIPGVASVLPSTSAEDLVFRDTLGQLPAIAVVDTAGDVQSLVGVGLKKQLVTQAFELSIAVVDESSAAAGRNTAREIWGQVNKRLHNYRSTVEHAPSRYQHVGYVWPDHPRIELQLMTVRYQIDAILGNE